jgi:hypothetical protein
MKRSLRELPAVVNDAGTTLFKRHLPRIIGLTEQRLRARNQTSWVRGVMVWKRFIALFAVRVS